MLIWRSDATVANVPRRWYRERVGRLEGVRASADVWLWAEGTALCFERVARDKAGGWLCKAYNALGDATAHTRLVVDDLFAVTLEPSVTVRLLFLQKCFHSFIRFVSFPKSGKTVQKVV